VADQYIDETYARAWLGTGYSDAAQVTGIDIEVMIEGCTAVVKAAAKNSGYPLPATDDPPVLADLDELLKLATFCVFREALASVPESTIPLPELWESSVFRTAYQKIIDGDLPVPSLDPSIAGAVGGVTFTDPDTEGNYERRATKTELGSY